MNKKVLIIALSLFSLSIYGQEITKKDLLGTYEQDLTEGHTWIHKEDGSSMEIAHGPSSVNYITLKRFNRFSTYHSGQIQMVNKRDKPYVQKGKWKRNGDQLLLYYNEDKTNPVEFSLINPCYLTPVNGMPLFTKTKPACTL